MKRQRTLIFILIVLALVTLACSLTAPKNTGNNSSPSNNSPANNAGEPGSNPVSSGPLENKPASRGSGDFDLADPAAGLADLDGYRQTLKIGFDGTVGGEQQQTETGLTRETLRDPQTELTWLEVSGQPGQFFGRAGDLDYRQPSPEAACAVAPAAEAPADAPAAFQLASLPAVYGAEAAGEETVNGIATRHYTFDERAIGYAGQAKASGEIWVAEPGGYVVRYTLRLEAPADLLGPGVAGVQTWEYELSEVNTGKTSLPEGCQPPQAAADLPMLDGAVVTQSLPGYLEYKAAGSVDDAVAFYQQQAEALGWKAENPFQFEGVTRLSLRPSDDGSLVQVSIKADGDGVVVTIQSLGPREEDQG